MRSKKMPAKKTSKKSARAESSSPSTLSSELPPPEFPRLSLPIQPPFAPMEARSEESIPESAEQNWLYEPKWDGFRCVAFRNGEEVVLQSKAGQPLTRYFPEVVSALAALPADKFVLDGELVIETAGHLDFNALLQRVHPAESRIRRLAAETPAQYLIFDLLVDAQGTSLVERPLTARKQALEKFFRASIRTQAAKQTLRLSQSSNDPADARAWLTGLASFGCDGVVAKLADEPYHSGDRDAMVKIKRQRTAECVVGGFRHATKKERGVGSLLLGLYNANGQLDHVGFCSSFTAAERLELLKTLKPLMHGEGFTGKAPGGPSRWNRDGRASEWEPLKPTLVVEVQFDHFSGGRFRHGTKFLRWRPEKPAAQCSIDQVLPPVGRIAA